MGLFRELRYELSSLIFGLGILGMIFSLTQYLIPTQSPDWLQSIHRTVGDYVVWEAFLGFLAVLGGGFYFVDTIRKEREFERLLSTPSKEIFVKNMGRIEELTYDHRPSAYERRFLDKKREFRIKGCSLDGPREEDASEALDGLAIARPTAHDDLDPIGTMNSGHDLRALVQPVELATRLGILRQDEMDLDRVRERVGDDVPQLVEPASGPRRDDDRRPMEFRLGEDANLRFDLIVREEVGFRQDRSNGIGGDFREERARGQPHLPLDLRLRIDDVHEEEHEIRLKDFLERRVERLDHPERHAIDEADRVREQDPLARPREAPRRRRQGREHPVIHDHAFVGEDVQEG